MGSIKKYPRLLDSYFEHKFILQEGVSSLNQQPSRWFMKLSVVGTPTIRRYNENHTLPSFKFLRNYLRLLATTLLIGFNLAGCNSLDTPSPVSPPSPVPLSYPSTPTVDVVDDYHGTLVADPFHWLEEMDVPEVQAWVEAQNSLTHGFFKQLPGRQTLHERIATLWTHEQATPPVRAGDRYFYRYSDGTHDQWSFLMQALGVQTLLKRHATDQNKSQSNEN